jgi:hypothetical protein
MGLGGSSPHAGSAPENKCLCCVLCQFQNVRHFSFVLNQNYLTDSIKIGTNFMVHFMKLFFFVVDASAFFYKLVKVREI